MYYSLSPMGPDLFPALKHYNTCTKYTWTQSVVRSQTDWHTQVSDNSDTLETFMAIRSSAHQTNSWKSHEEWGFRPAPILTSSRYLFFWCISSSKFGPAACYSKSFTKCSQETILWHSTVHLMSTTSDRCSAPMHRMSRTEHSSNATLPCTASHLASTGWAPLYWLMACRPFCCQVVKRRVLLWQHQLWWWDTLLAHYRNTCVYKTVIPFAHVIVTMRWVALPSAGCWWAKYLLSAA
jgi:hypothetical protein